MFIFAYALGFYILLHKDDGHEPEDDEYPFFNYLGLCVVKTFTMFVGELEFADLPIESPVGYLFFLTFIFLIVVVMMNLLNGLAVSDTGIIKAEAEINFYKCQVEVISYVEAMMLGDPFNFLAMWPTYVWLRRIPACSLGNVLYRIPPLRSVFHHLTGAKSILLFYDYLPDKSITFYPNQERNLCGGCLTKSKPTKEYLDFPSTIMEDSKVVVLEQLNAQDGVEQRLARTEQLLQQLSQNQQEVETKLEQILSLLQRK